LGDVQELLPDERARFAGHVAVAQDHAPLVPHLHVSAP
jgi:hypothetical protein